MRLRFGIEPRECIPRRTLHSTPRCWFPSRTDSTHWAMLHPCRVEGGSPTSLIVLSELEIVALTMHSHGYSPNTIPGIQVAPEGPECSVIREHRTSTEPDGCTQELAALVEHALLDDVVRLESERLRDGQPQRLGGFEIDHQLELGRLLDREIGGLGAL